MCCLIQVLNLCLFADFRSLWRILHVTSSPKHHHENGKAEAAVKSAKNMLKRTALQHQEEYLASLELHNTPCQDARESPSEIVWQSDILSFTFPAQILPQHRF